MAELIDEKTRKELARILGEMPGPVKVIFFTQENACPACRHQQHILEEITKLTDKVSLEVYDFVKDANQATRFGIDKIPATPLSAYNYLIEHKLVAQKAVPDSWQQ